MENTQQYPLTAFLLDLTESEDLRLQVDQNLDEIIEQYGLQEHRKILEKRDVQALRAAVREEVTGERREGPGMDDECVIQGIRRPPNPPPP